MKSLIASSIVGNRMAGMLILSPFYQAEYGIDADALEPDIVHFSELIAKFDHRSVALRQKSDRARALRGKFAHPNPRHFLWNLARPKQARTLSALWQVSQRRGLEQGNLAQSSGSIAALFMHGKRTARFRQNKTGLHNVRYKASVIQYLHRKFNPEKYTDETLPAAPIAPSAKNNLSVPKTGQKQLLNDPLKRR